DARPPLRALHLAAQREVALVQPHHPDAQLGHPLVLGEQVLHLALRVLVPGQPATSLSLARRSAEAPASASDTTPSRSSRVRNACAYGEPATSRCTRGQSICSRSDRASGSALVKSQ